MCKQSLLKQVNMGMYKNKTISKNFKWKRNKSFWINKRKSLERNEYKFRTDFEIVKNVIKKQNIDGSDEGKYENIYKEINYNFDNNMNNNISNTFFVIYILRL